MSSDRKIVWKARFPVGLKTSYRAGGFVALYSECEDLEQLRVARCVSLEKRMPFRVLGKGANVLVTDEGFHGIVVSLTGATFRQCGIDDDLITVGAGVPLGTVISASMAKGLGGLEHLAGVPATVGGAIACNAGGRDGDIGQHVQWCDILTDEGRVERVEVDRDDFGYRSSKLSGALIVQAGIKLTRSPAAEIKKRFRDYLAQKKASQPLGSPSAGCIFKNPRGISASRLMARCGLLGLRMRSAMISPKHGNFFICDVGGSTDDVLMLAAYAQRAVQERANIDLQLEIDVWGDSCFS